ncbi:hypothetical protein ACRAWF_47340 [Streptomyces sp. L7]
MGWPWNGPRGYPDPSWADATSAPAGSGCAGGTGRSRGGRSLLARRLTEHRAEAEVTVAARPLTFTQAAGLVLWYGAEAYLSLDLTWAEPEGEGQRGQQWRDGGGRTVLRLVEREEDVTREVAVVEVEFGASVTLGATVDGADARFWYVRDGERVPVGPVLDFSRLSDDHGSRLRFTGAMAGIHAVDLVGAEFTADFGGFRLECTPPR